MTKQQTLLGTGFLLLLVAACATQTEEGGRSNVAHHEGSEAGDVPQRPATVAERRKLRQQLASEQAGKFKDRPNLQPGKDSGARGEVPDEMLAKMIDDLASKVAADRAGIDVLQAESTTFSDGSLGCGKPGQDYTQALVPGYRVILVHAGQQFDYRATAKGFFLLCEQPTLAAPGAGNRPPVQ